MRISVISKATRVHKAMTVANNASLCSTILVVLLEFIPGNRAEISHMNTPQNSSWYSSRLPGSYDEALSWQQKFVCLRESRDRKEFYKDNWALVPVDKKIECL